ncbi:MAG TPA: Hsp20 family protein [Spirochaetota bacterium]|nr:Hsp20 family protein [Spirochaetota bacterium]HOL56076.1 Hsp20 family protein [Spirochaetota bacterium]HPP03510.1 Hsp20 family protein [Spirochaetota bacterium]
MSRDLVKHDFFNDAISSFFDEGWKGFKWLSRFSKEFDKILNGRCDFEEKDDSYLIELEVPGVKKDEIEITLKNEVLTINWSRKSEKKKGLGSKGVYERSEGSFSRSFSVEGADEKGISAELKDGVLKIVVPKVEGAKAKKIEIK